MSGSLTSIPGNVSLIKRGPDGYVTVEPMTNVPTGTGIYGPDQSATSYPGGSNYGNYAKEEDNIAALAEDLSRQCLFLNPEELLLEAKRTLENPNYKSSVVTAFEL